MAKKFVFKLESLKKIRHHRLWMARKALADIDVQLSIYRQNIEQSQSEIGRLLDDVRRADASVVKLLSDLIAGEKIRIGRYEDEIRSYEKERERAQAWVAECAREHRALERLEEKKREIYQHEQSQREKRLADQMLTERYARSLALAEHDGKSELES